MADILEIKKVSKTYNSQSDNPVIALNDVDLNVAEGEFVSIIGPSGCGKSTLFNVIGGLIDDHEGEVLIEGRPVDGAHKDVGVVFQEESTFPWRSTLDNVHFRLKSKSTKTNEKNLHVHKACWSGWLRRSLSCPALWWDEATDRGCPNACL